MSNPKGNPDIKKYGFKTDRLEPLTAKLSMRVTDSMLTKLKEKENCRSLLERHLPKHYKKKRSYNLPKKPTLSSSAVILCLYKVKENKNLIKEYSF